LSTLVDPSITVLLTLQKLIRTKKDDSDSESEEEDPKRASGPQQKHKGSRQRWFQRKKEYEKTNGPAAPSDKHAAIAHEKGSTTGHSFGAVPAPTSSSYRTLQRYRGGVNIDRALYMERNSMLTKKDLAVSVEQVSIFLTANNTVVSFFEHSADDIEAPILRRLDSADTILRRSQDASMLLQAVIDAIIDLAIPVTAAYEDILGELEVDVLTDPDIDNSRSMYIISSELSILRNNMQPVANVIAALREHRNDPACK
jgi:Mg2+ and Co2+ transporter CorA